MKKQLLSQLKRYGCYPKKKYGQHYLVSKNALDRIIAFMGIEPADTVIEAAAGPGVLTERICDITPNVIAVEKDESLAPVFYDRLENRTVKLVIGDILHLNWEDLIEKSHRNSSGRILLVGNLPYQIASIFLTKILKKQLLFSEISIMIQREVAERCTSSPGVKAYGFLTCLIQYYAETIAGPVINRNSFYPAPGVSSRMLKLVPRKSPPFKIDEDEFFTFIKKVFQYRRKQLAGSLSHIFDLPVAGLKDYLTGYGWDMSRRPESCTVHDFKKLFDQLKRKGLLNGYR